MKTMVGFAVTAIVILCGAASLRNAFLRKSAPVSTGLPPTVEASVPGPALTEWQEIWAGNNPMPPLLAGATSAKNSGREAPAQAYPPEASLQLMLDKFEQLEKRLNAMEKAQERMKTALAIGK